MSTAVLSQPPTWTRSFGFGFTAVVVGALGAVFALIPMFALAAVIHGSLALGFGLPPVISKKEGFRLGALGVVLGVVALGLGTVTLVTA